jgi:hypothetical protein
MRAAFNDSLEGYVLLDTGASYSAISRRTAQALRSSAVSAVGLRGANGAMDCDVMAAGVRVQVAGGNLTAEPVVALDLARFSAFNGVETAAVLGYPALRASVITVDYRDALVRIDGPLKGGRTHASMADKRKAGAP